MNDHGLTPEELKQRHGEAIAKANTFNTYGVGAGEAKSYLKTSEGVMYLTRLSNAFPDTPIEDLRRRAISQITSGRELPRMELNAEPLVKIVPRGSQPTPHSPYWTKASDLDAAVKEGRNLSQHFALPIASESARYDVYRITPKAPTEVFVNTVAPTSELGGLVTKPGGARQVLTPNRQLYEPHAFVSTVENRPHVPLKGHALRPTVKAMGVLGTAYGAYDAKHQIEAAIEDRKSVV